MRRGRRGPFTSIATHVVPGPGLLTSVKRMLLRSGGRAKLQSETRKSWTSCAVLTSWCHQWSSWEDSSGVWGCWAAATDSHGTTSCNGYNLIKLNNTQKHLALLLWVCESNQGQESRRSQDRQVKLSKLSIDNCDVNCLCWIKSWLSWLILDIDEQHSVTALGHQTADNSLMRLMTHTTDTPDNKNNSYKFTTVSQCLTQCQKLTDLTQ